MGRRPSQSLGPADTHGTVLNNRTLSNDLQFCWLQKGYQDGLVSGCDGAIFTAKVAGKSAWERHPNGDEIVQVIDGATTLHLITSEGRQSLTLSAGMMVVVPQNAWHQFESPGGVCVMTATPQPSEHIRVDVDDPRT